MDRPVQTNPQETLRRAQRVEIVATRMVNDAMVGAYLSRFKGRGTDFEELREYVPGDDVRAMDWNVTARMGKPFIRLHREERELTMVIALDVSGLARLNAQLGNLTVAQGVFNASVTGLEDLAAMLTSGGVTVLAFGGERNHFPSELGEALNGLGTASSAAGAIVLLAQTPAAMNLLKGTFPVAADALGQAGLA